MKVFTVVTCMGRLSHLMESLPTFPRPVVMVDYSCPDQCGEWAASEAGYARVVMVPGETFFNRSKALNAGAEEAMRSGAEWLFFVDADVVVSPDLIPWLERRKDGRGFSIAPAGKENESLAGVLLTKSDDFLRAGRFEEAYDGWGVEDVDMRLRLRLIAGCEHDRIPDGLLVPIPHDDELRTRHYPIKNRWISRAVNARKLEQKIRDLTGRGPSELDEVSKSLMRT